MRRAFATPLPPATSGIADYSAELAPHLVAAGAELTLFYEGAAAPDPAFAARFPCRPLAELGAALDRERFAAVVYQLGNSAGHHEQTYRTLLERPGIVVLHEFMLHHVVRELTLVRGDAAAYVEEMRYAAGATGRAAARRLLDTHYPVDVWAFPLFERVVDRSLGVLVHSEFTRQRLLRSRPLAHIGCVPMPVDLGALAPPTSAQRASARAALGIDAGAPLLASFGFVTPNKHLEPALVAFARLRAERPDARFAVVGEISRHYDFDEVLARVGAAGVTVTGRVPLNRLHDWMVACDVAVNLRHPTGGETSATLFRLLALARPTLVSDSGSFAELPDGAVAKVEVGPDEVEQIAALFRRLLSDPPSAEALGRQGRRAVERDHALPEVAGRYLSFVRETLARASAPAPAVAPLAPWPEGDVATALLASVGADLADLGAGEDEAALAAVAAALVELGLDGGEGP
jgi:glycosyltransferase involved in cell wall biosynthesis